MIVRNLDTGQIDKAESKIYRKDGMLTTAAFKEELVMRKRIAGKGYVEYYRVIDVYVVKGFAPKFFFEEFYDRREADKFYRNLK